MVPIIAPSFGSHTIQESGAARPAEPPEAPRSALLEILALSLIFWFVFRIPIAKSRLELSKGPVSEFENRPVSSSLRNDRQQIPHSPTLKSAPSCKSLQ